MAHDEITLDVLERLRLFTRVTARRMFGGAGIYRDGVFFGLTAYGKFFLRVDDASRGKFQAAGMDCFRPSGHTVVMKTYYEVPVHIFRSAEELCGWATEAWEIAKLAKLKKPAKVKKPAKPKKAANRNTTSKAAPKPVKPNSRGQKRSK